MLHTAAARVGALDIGFVPGAGGLDAQAMAKAGAQDVVFLVGADEISVEPGAFVVYIGSHGDRGAHRADVDFAGRRLYREIRDLCEYRRPGANVRPRRLPPGEAREDWAIFRALSGALGKALPFNC